MCQPKCYMCKSQLQRGSQSNMFKFERGFCNIFIILLRHTKNGMPGYNATYVSWSTKTRMLDAMRKCVLQANTQVQKILWRHLAVSICACMY